VRAGIQRYADAGTTDFNLALFGTPDQMKATTEVVQSLL
jgi:hypothetical protein